MHGGFPNLHSDAAEFERPNPEYIAGPSELGGRVCFDLVLQAARHISLALSKVLQCVFLPSRSLGKLKSRSYSSNGSKQKTMAAKSTITTRKSSCRCGSTLHWSSCQDSTCCLATKRVQDSRQDMGSAPVARVHGRFTTTRGSSFLLVAGFGVNRFAEQYRAIQRSNHQPSKAIRPQHAVLLACCPKCSAS